MATVTGTPTYIMYGPCQITFDGTDLGYFKGGSTFRYDVTYIDVKPDQLSSKLKSFVTGEACVLTVPMLETDLAKLTLVMPTGSYTLDGTKKKIQVGGDQLASTDYKEVVLTETTDGSGTISTDSNTKVTIHSALAQIKLEKAYNMENERIVPVEFHGYADTTNSAGNQLFELGDATAT